MKNKTKWIVGGLAAIVLIVAILFGTNSEFFKGQLAPSRRLVNERRCEKMKKWFDEGTLSSRLGVRTGEYVAQCEDLYPAIWYGYGSARHCELLRLWLAQGVLTDNLRGRTAIASTCSTYPDIWNNFATPERCEFLENAVEEGSLTPDSVGYGYEEYLVCQEIDEESSAT